MMDLKSPDLAARLTEALAHAEVEQEALARMLALETDLSMPLIARALALSAEARHAAASEAGAAVTRAIMHIAPESEADLKIAQAVADIIAPRKGRH